MLRRFLPDSVKPYAGRILITVLALVAAILMLTIGFWKTILVVAVVTVGYFFGLWIDGGIHFKKTDPSKRVK